MHKLKKNCKNTPKNTDSELLLHNYRFTCSRRKHAWNSRFLFEIAYYYYCDGCDCACRMNAHFCAFYCSDSTYHDNIVKHYTNIDKYHFLFKTQLAQFRSKKVLLQNFNNSKLLNIVDVFLKARIQRSCFFTLNVLTYCCIILKYCCIILKYYFCIVGY